MVQGALYLSNAWHGEARGMSVAHRAAKVAELWKQLVWLEGSLEACETKEGFDVEAVSFESNEKGQQVSSGPFLTGANLSLSDFTWFPTITFMEVSGRRRTLFFSLFLFNVHYLLILQTF